MTQEQIKNEYAVSQGYGYWNELLLNNDSFTVGNLHLNKVMKIYARECLKLASDNIRFNKSTQETKENFIVVKDVCRDDIIYITANKDSIINENNIIK